MASHSSEANSESQHTTTADLSFLFPALTQAAALPHPPSRDERPTIQQLQTEYVSTQTHALPYSGAPASAKRSFQQASHSVSGLTRSEPWTELSHLHEPTTSTLHDNTPKRSFSHAHIPMSIASQSLTADWTRSGQEQGIQLPTVNYSQPLHLESRVQASSHLPQLSTSIQSQYGQHALSNAGDFSFGNFPPLPPGSTSTEPVLGVSNSYEVPTTQFSSQSIPTRSVGPSAVDQASFAASFHSTLAASTHPHPQQDSLEPFFWDDLVAVDATATQAPLATESTQASSNTMMTPQQLHTPVEAAAPPSLPSEPDMSDAAVAFALQVLGKPHARLCAPFRDAQGNFCPTIYCIIQHTFGASPEVELTSAFNRRPHAAAELGLCMRRLNRKDGGQVFTDLVEQTVGERYIQLACMNGQQPAYGMELLPVPVQGVLQLAGAIEGTSVVFAVLISKQTLNQVKVTLQVAAVHKAMAGANAEADDIMGSMDSNKRAELHTVRYGNRQWILKDPHNDFIVDVSVRRVHLRDKGKSGAPKALKEVYWVFFERMTPSETVSRYDTIAEATRALSNVAISADILTQSGDPAIGWSMDVDTTNSRGEVTKVFKKHDPDGDTTAKLWSRSVIVV
eukprot:m.91924 g.91924  ORF g.91924 m.91924 type:complete len:622 (+) comp14924_c0_seq1:230-2095(+)